MLNLNIEEKVAAVVERLRTLKTVDKKSVATEISDKVDEKGVFYGSDEDFKPFESPYILFEQDKYFCFRGSFEIEEIRDDEKAYLSIETFIGGVAPTIRPQGLLKLNGEIIQGIDINHTDVLLDPGKYDMELIFYTHIFGLSLPVYFSVKRENTLINDLYNDLSVALAGMKLLLKNTDDYVFAKYHLERAINLIDFREEYGAEFFNSLKCARDYLYKNYFGKGEGIRPVVNCVGHTHIDVAWLWDEEQTRQKTERSFATALKLMEEYPEYKFMMSQPQLRGRVQGDIRHRQKRGYDNELARSFKHAFAHSAQHVYKPADNAYFFVRHIQKNKGLQNLSGGIVSARDDFRNRALFRI